jgi:TrpR-related protein YerC/YecD
VKVTPPETKKIGKLYAAFAKLKNANEAAKFLRDICTIAEINAMSERLEVARLLGQGKTYREISSLTGSSTATVTRVAQWLHHGMGGYKLMLARLK